jgi:phosphoglucosamine mutase
VIFTDHATTGDGMLTALALLDVVQRSGRQLSQLSADAMTQLPQVLVNVPVAERRSDINELLAAEISAAAEPLGSTGRILVRPSGTEPLVRVMVEAPTAELAQSTAEHLADVVRRHPDLAT